MICNYEPLSISGNFLFLRKDGYENRLALFNVKDNPIVQTTEITLSDGKIKNANFITDSIICVTAKQIISKFPKIEVNYHIKYFHKDLGKETCVSVEPFETSFIFRDKGIWLIQDLEDSAFCKIEIYCYNRTNKKVEHLQTTSLAGYFVELANDSKNVFVATSSSKYNIGPTHAIYRLDFQGKKLGTLNVKMEVPVRKMKVFNNNLFFLSDECFHIYNLKQKYQMVNCKT